MNCLSEIQWAVLKALRKVVANRCRPFGYAYNGYEDLLLQHGVWYQGQWPGGYKQGLAKMCYGNAILLAARDGLKYVEGVALSPDGQIIPHAWNQTASGVLVDSTWLNIGLAYLGIEFSVERADDATWNGDGAVLDDEKRGDLILKSRWRGEDYSREWPASERIRLIRHGTAAEAHAYFAGEGFGDGR